MHLLIFVQAANAGKASVKVLNSLGPGMPFFSTEAKSRTNVSWGQSAETGTVPRNWEHLVATHHMLPIPGRSSICLLAF